VFFVLYEYSDVQMRNALKRHSVVSCCKCEYDIRRSDSGDDADGNLQRYDVIRIRKALQLTFWRRNYFLNFSTPCI